MIKRIHYNPPGPDTASKLNEEYIILENREEREVPLGGWVLKDSTPTGKRRHVYTFPAQLVLGPGHLVHLYTGKGRDSFEEAGEKEPPRWNFYWGRGHFVWNNEGDTATLLDAKGKLVDSLQVVPLKG